MKKSLAILLALTLPLSLAACSSSGGGYGTQTEVDDPYAHLETYELSFSMHAPAESTIGKCYQDMFDEISEKTHGHLNITVFGGATLAAASDVASMVETGGCDMGWMFSSFYPGQFPLTDVIALPMMGQTTCERGTQVLWDIRENYPEMEAEWDRFHIVNMYANPTNTPYTTKIEPTDINAFKGLTMRTADGGAAACIGGWGVNAIQMPPNEIYESLEKNNIQGFTFEPTGIIDYSLQEVTGYKLDMGIFQATFCTVMNKESYEGLPDAFREILDEYSTREQSIKFAKAWDAYVKECDQMLVDAGGTIITPTDEQYAEYKVSADAYVKNWIKERSANGFDAQEYYDFVVAAYEKY